MQIRRTAAALTATAALTLSGVVAATPAQAQPVDQDGLVNVNIGDVTILEDVNIGIAAQIAANICGVKVGPVAVLGTAVDRSGDTSTVCESAQGPIRLEQN